MCLLCNMRVGGDMTHFFLMGIGCIEVRCFVVTHIFLWLPQYQPYHNFNTCVVCVLVIHGVSHGLH